MAPVIAAPVKPMPKSAGSSRFHPAFVVAWLFSVLFYFMQYVGVSAPSVMVPELTTAFNLTTLALVHCWDCTTTPIQPSPL